MDYNQLPKYEAVKGLQKPIIQTAQSLGLGLILTESTSLEDFLNHSETQSDKQAVAGLADVNRTNSAKKVNADKPVLTPTTYFEAGALPTFKLSQLTHLTPDNPVNSLIQNTQFRQDMVRYINNELDLNLSTSQHDSYNFNRDTAYIEVFNYGSDFNFAVTQSLENVALEYMSVGEHMVFLTKNSEGKVYAYFVRREEEQVLIYEIPIN
ncbi:MAG: hypothetical protein OHK0017_06740 [Patescibacteria group bacterium]